MDFSKILTLVAGVFLACSYIQAYPLATDAQVPEPAHPQHGYGVVLDYIAHPKYQFDYSVYDPDTGDVKKQWESRDGDVVHGSYTIHDPDGTIRTVDYTAGKHTGFNAVVKRLGKSYHPKTVVAQKYVVGHSYAGGSSEQVANVEQGRHAEVRAELPGQAEQGSHFAWAPHQSPEQHIATFQPAEYQPTPFQAASHEVEPQHIVSHQTVTHHILPQALPLKAEENQPEPQQGASNKPEEEAKPDPTAEAEQTNETNEVAPKIEAVEPPKEESKGNEEPAQLMMVEQIQQDDGSVYYVPVNFDSRRYRSAEKSKRY